MRAPPEPPQKRVVIGDSEELGSEPTLRDVFAATNKLVARFPDVEMNEIRVVYDSGYYDGFTDDTTDDTTLGDTFILSFSRSVPNPAYDSEFAKYQTDMAEFEREVAEKKAKDDAAHRLSVEQAQAKKRYKEQQRLLRIWFRNY